MYQIYLTFRRKGSQTLSTIENKLIKMQKADEFADIKKASEGFGRKFQLSKIANRKVGVAGNSRQIRVS